MRPSAFEAQQADWAALRLEPMFQIDPSGEFWGVVDAEGATVAICKTQQMARVVVAVLDAYAEVMG